MKKIKVGFLLTLVGCTTSARMEDFKENDPTKLFGHGRGVYSYQTMGREDLVKQREENGIELAKEYCGSDKVGVVNIHGTDLDHIKVVPIEDAESNSFAVPDNHSGRTYVNYVCLDANVDNKYYRLIYSRNNAPICTSIPKEFAPGIERFKTVSSKDGSELCMKNGYLIFLDTKQYFKDHLFYGPAGLKTCQHLEAKAVKNNVQNLDLNRFIRANLKCL